MKFALLLCFVMAKASSKTQAVARRVQGSEWEGNGEHSACHILSNTITFKSMGGDTVEKVDNQKEDVFFYQNVIQSSQVWTKSRFVLPSFGVPKPVVH